MPLTAPKRTHEPLDRPPPVKKKTLTARLVEVPDDEKLVPVGLRTEDVRGYLAFGDHLPQETSSLIGPWRLPGIHSWIGLRLVKNCRDFWG